MLTELEWKTLKGAIGLICSTHCTPFDWDRTNSLLVPTKFKFKASASLCILCVTIIYTCYTVLRLPETYFARSSNLGDLVMHILCCVWYTTVAVWHYIVEFKCRAEFSTLFNQQIHFNFARGLAHGDGEFVKARKREVFVRYGVPSNLQILPIWVSLTVVKRNKSFFLYSCLPEIWKTGPVLVAVTVFETLFTLSYQITLFLLFYVTFTYLSSSSYWLRQICVRWPKTQLAATWTHREERMKKLEAAFRLYRSTEVLNKIFNNCFSSLLIPELKVLTIVASCSPAYAVIKYRSSMHPLMEVMLTAIAVFQLAILLSICIAGASLHDNTKRFHTNYQYVIMKLPREQQKYYKRVARSSPPFGFRVGSYYVIKKITIASVIYLLLNTLMFLLLTY